MISATVHLLSASTNIGNRNKHRDRTHAAKPASLTENTGSRLAIARSPLALEAGFIDLVLRITLKYNTGWN